MLYVLSNSWALLLGMLLLLLGNGLQGTLLGVRGGIEGFDASTMSLVMSAYFMGFLLGSRLATPMIRRVGHVRVFAALASLISAAFILYAAAPESWLWMAMRLLVGFCFAGVYIVAESWLNEAATNDTRGKALSLYMIIQMVGLVAAQGVLNFADPSGYTLFIVMSVLVSVSFAPILLSVTAAPAFETTKPMPLFQLFKISPLGCVGTFLNGGIFAGLFGMAAVFGTEKGFSVAQVSAFVAAIYTGGMVLQFPIGWLSDNMDRRKLIAGATLVAGGALFIGVNFSGIFEVTLALAFVAGAVANPLYSLLIAYTNDFLEHSDMAAASSGLVFINGLGAVVGTPTIGWLMSVFGPDAFFHFLGWLFLFIAGYALFRMTRRRIDTSGSLSYAPVAPQASWVAMEAAQEYAIDSAAETGEDGEELPRAS